MDAWRDIRLKARACHLKALSVAQGDRRGRALVDAALKDADLELRYCHAGGVHHCSLFDHRTHDRHHGPAPAR